uniref:Uncharacterized protein n=1 Tax=Rhizophora mucronata TaxID=61149 RepID=A0A2P2R5C6_RHIMU
MACILIVFLFCVFCFLPFLYFFFSYRFRLSILIFVSVFFICCRHLTSSRFCVC